MYRRVTVKTLIRHVSSYIKQSSDDGGHVMQVETSDIPSLGTGVNMRHVFFQSKSRLWHFEGTGEELHMSSQAQGTLR